MKVTYLYVYLFFLILMIACNKNDASTNAEPSIETVEAIVMTPGEATPNGTIYNITIIEPTGSIRWEKRQWGVPITRNDGG